MAQPVLIPAFRAGYSHTMLLFGKPIQVGPQVSTFLPHGGAAGTPLYVKESGRILQGVDLRGRDVIVQANGVIIRNCLIDAAGLHTIWQQGTASGLVIEFCRFDSLGGSRMSANHADYVMSDNGVVTIRNCEVLDAPRDALNLPAGTIQHNAIVGAFWADGAHADAVSVHRTTGPVVIRENYMNFMLTRPAKGPNACIKIVSHFGPISGVTVDKNILIGGGYNAYVARDKGDISSVKFSNNLMGLTEYGDAPGRFFTSNTPFENTANELFSAHPDGVVKMGAAGSAPAPQPAPAPTPTPAPEAKVPVNTTKPKIEGDAKVGGKVRTASGVWQNVAPDWKWQWQWELDGKPLPGLTSYEATVPAAGSLTVVVGVTAPGSQTVWVESDPVVVPGSAVPQPPTPTVPYVPSKPAPVPVSEADYKKAVAQATSAIRDILTSLEQLGR